MPPCHVKPFLRQSTYSPEPTPAPEAAAGSTPVAQDACEYCGRASLVWRKCKLICTSCQQINKSCADL